jgi:hypothetical protein
MSAQQIPWSSTDCDQATLKSRFAALRAEFKTLYKAKQYAQALDILSHLLSDEFESICTKYVIVGMSRDFLANVDHACSV